jgi:hypothetical protein
VLFYLSDLPGITRFKESATRVKENELTLSVEVYPNPAKDLVTINLTTPQAWSGLGGTLLTAEGKPIKPMTYMVNLS